MSTASGHHVTLSLDVSATPATGSVRIEGGDERAFTGLIELFSILNGLARPADDALMQARQTRLSSGGGIT